MNGFPLFGNHLKCLVGHLTINLFIYIYIYIYLVFGKEHLLNALNDNVCI